MSARKATSLALLGLAVALAQVALAQENPFNCGGKVCATGATCVSGACKCPADKPNQCGTICTHLGTDFFNCGSCGYKCNINQGVVGFQCIQGICQCPEPLTDCITLCANLTSDVNNCGGCGNKCPNGAKCVDGQCTCRAGQTKCDGQCVNTQASVSHCGACNKPCPIDATCVKGACVCPRNGTVCGGACVDTMTSRNHCGRCNRQVTSNAKCVNGTVVCNGKQFTKCGSLCVNTMVDEMNCGGCNDATLSRRNCANYLYPKGAKCIQGKCQCPKDNVLCTSPSDYCAKLNTVWNCGACGTVCATGQDCKPDGKTFKCVPAAKEGNPFSKPGFGLAETHQAIQDSTRLHGRLGGTGVHEERVNTRRCYAATTVEVAITEMAVVDGLNSTLRGLVQSGELQRTQPHLAELVKQFSFECKPIASNEADYLAVQHCPDRGVLSFTGFQQQAARYLPSKGRSAAAREAMLVPRNSTYVEQLAAAEVENKFPGVAAVVTNVRAAHPSPKSVIVHKWMVTMGKANRKELGMPSKVL